MLKTAYPDSMSSTKFWEEKGARHTSHILIVHTTLNQYDSKSFKVSTFLQKTCTFPIISSLFPISPPKSIISPWFSDRFSGYHRVARHGITRWNCYQRLGAPGEMGTSTTSTKGGGGKVHFSIPFLRFLWRCFGLDLVSIIFEDLVQLDGSTSMWLIQSVAWRNHMIQSSQYPSCKK